MNEAVSHSSSSSSLESNEAAPFFDTGDSNEAGGGVVASDSSSADQSSSSEETSSQISQHGQNDDAEDLGDLPSARDHSYLPGTTHPLFPVEFLRNSHCHDRKNTSGVLSQSPSGSFNEILEQNTVELPILQLDGVILFPNSSLPLRITNASFCQYLRREIDRARASITSYSQNDACDYIRGDPMQVRIGIITRLRGRRRREPQRVRRLDAVGGEDTDEHQGNPPIRRRMGRWNLNLIRRNIIPSRHSEDESSSDESSSDESNVQRLRPGLRRLPPEERSINYGRALPTDILKDRIGTFATITSVNEANSADDGGGINSQHLIITAMATGRFKVVSPVDKNESMDDFEWRSYNVLELNDDPLTIPSSLKRPRPWKTLENSNKRKESDIILGRKNALLTEISNRSNLSMHSLRLIWPENLVKVIVSEIESNNLYEGVTNILPSVNEQYNGTFSFWLSSNLPLSNDEKLDVLESECEVGRLTLILKSIRKRTQYICCNQCRSNIAQVSKVFTVGSAEGTSGAYVNEHGVVHQTTTLQSTLDDAIVCLGDAETRDSWFPGYSWTIAYCATCFNHLGWKFLRVRNDVHPQQFWGLSGSQIT